MNHFICERNTNRGSSESYCRLYRLSQLGYPRWQGSFFQVTQKPLLACPTKRGISREHRSQRHQRGRSSGRRGAGTASEFPGFMEATSHASIWWLAISGPSIFFSRGVHPGERTVPVSRFLRARLPHPRLGKNAQCVKSPRQAPHLRCTT